MKHKNLFSLFVVICIFCALQFKINLSKLQLNSRSATRTNEVAKLSVELISQNNSVSLKQEQNIIDNTTDYFTFKNIKVGTTIKITATISQEDKELYVGETEWLNVKPNSNLISLVLEKIYYPESKVTLTFDSNGGSSVEAITGIPGETFTRPTNPTKTGYTFDCWEPELPEVFPEEDTTYTAQWLEKGTYKITYKLDGGENNSANPPTYKETDNDITLYDPTKSGYTFDGWKNEDGNIVTSILAGTTGNITLYAQWKAIEGTISVTFPSYSDSHGVISPSYQNNQIQFIAKSGYTCIWYLDDEKQAETSSVYTIDTTNMEYGGIYTVMLIATNDDTGEMYSAEYQIEIRK